MFSQYDDDFIRDVSHAKRYLELWTQIGEFRLLAGADLIREVRRYGLDLDLAAMPYLYDEEAAKRAGEGGAPLPLLVERYRRFIGDKLAQRKLMQESWCIPAHERFRKWRQRQVNRCWMEFGAKNAAMIHTPVMFELSRGCSVGCPFCGLSAGKLSGVFAFNAENEALWRDLLRRTRAIVGDAAGTGACYYATEPFDNPDYERFADIYEEELGRVPQVTTAVAMRQPERTMAFIGSANEKRTVIHRFSVLSRAALEKVLAYFSPEELCLVELLPQFSEAPSNGFVPAGRLAVPDGAGGDTICCVSGFVVNMVERRVRLMTPCPSSGECPTGERVLCAAGFADGDGYSATIESMIAEFMRSSPGDGGRLRFCDSLQVSEEDAGLFLSKTERGVQLRLPRFKDATSDIFVLVGREMAKGESTRDDIAMKLYTEHGVAPENVYYAIGKLYDGGLIDER